MATPPDGPVDLSAKGLLQGTLDGLGRHPGPLLLPLTLAGLLTSVTSIGLASWAGIPLGGGPVPTPDLLVPQVVLAVLTASLLTLVVSLVAHAYAWAFTTRAALDALDGGGLDDLGAVARGVNPLFGPVLWVLVLWGVMFIFGLLALIVPGLIVAAGFVPAAAVVLREDARGLDALGRAWALTRGHRGPLFLLLVLYVVGNIVAAGVGSMLPQPLGEVVSAAVSGALLAGWCVLGALFYHRRLRKEAAPFDDGFVP